MNDPRITQRVTKVLDRAAEEISEIWMDEVGRPNMAIEDQRERDLRAYRASRELLSALLPFAAAQLREWVSMNTHSWNYLAKAESVGKGFFYKPRHIDTLDFKYETGKVTVLLRAVERLWEAYSELMPLHYESVYMDAERKKRRT